MYHLVSQAPLSISSVSYQQEFNNKKTFHLDAILHLTRLIVLLLHVFWILLNALKLLNLEEYLNKANSPATEFKTLNIF